MLFRWILPAGGVALLALIAAKRAIVARRIGRDPIVVRPGRDLDTAHGFLEWMVTLGGVALVADVLLHAFAHSTLVTHWGIAALQRAEVLWTGLVFLSAGSLLIAVAIVTMGASWRIGIDRDTPGALVTGGLFGVVRHPIYAGMLALSLGLALVGTDALSLIIASAAWIGLPIQARLEEAFLLDRHRDPYDAYMRRTGRFVPWMGRLRDEPR